MFTTTTLRRTAFLLPLTLSFALTGCGGGSNGAGSSPGTPAAPLSVSAVTPSGLTATLAEDKSAIAAGGSVIYTLTLTNNTSQPITYQEVEYSSLGAALQITNASGQTIFPASGTGGGVSPTPPPTSVPATLAPGQTLSATLVQGSVFSSAGSYAATVTEALISGSSSVTDTTIGPLTVTVL